MINTTTPSSIAFSPLTSLFLALLIGFSLIGCPRSSWIQSDGSAVDPKEQLKCAKQIQQQTKGIIVSQEALERQIEQCLREKGYQRVREINTASLSSS